MKIENLKKGNKEKKELGWKERGIKAQEKKENCKSKKKKKMVRETQPTTTTRNLLYRRLQRGLGIGKKDSARGCWEKMGWGLVIFSFSSLFFSFSEYNY